MFILLLIWYDKKENGFLRNSLEEKVIRIHLSWTSEDNLEKSVCEANKIIFLPNTVDTRDEKILTKPYDD